MQRLLLAVMSIKNQKVDILILGGARDYHAMDWYRTVRSLSKNCRVSFCTDMICAEGFTNLIAENDDVCKLFIIDKLLFREPSRLGDMWRNFVKLLFLPVQVLLLRRMVKNVGYPIIHAHPMYYMLICWMANLEYIGTPQGSELLIRPHKSKFYKYMASTLLRSAKSITVDSRALYDAAYDISGVMPIIVQTGIDLDEILATIRAGTNERYRICSIRGLAPIYRIDTILRSRNASNIKSPLTFSYPFFDSNYKNSTFKMLKGSDCDLGRLSTKKDLYSLLAETLLVISIPSSDSSPRSVYEAIFLGCCVATVESQWVVDLPPCMRERVITIDLADQNWFDGAINIAQRINKKPFVPSEMAIQIFDQNKSINSVIDKLYS